MKLKILALSVLAALTGNMAGAQDFFSWGFGAPQPQQESRVKFIYDANFDYHFDNREFSAGGNRFTNSMTIYGARLTPSVGLQVRQNANVKHKLMLGIDIMKDFGRHPSDVASSSEHDRHLDNTRLFREMTMYYGIDAKLGAWKLQGYAGMFPRSFSEGEYSQVFFSDSLKFYDNNLDGVLVKACHPRAYMEVVFDWNGMIGSYRREQFNAFGFGKYRFCDLFSAGLAFKYHHYANAEEYIGVVDDAMVQPFVRFNFGHYCGWQDISATLSWYQALQQDRRFKNGSTGPGGAELTLSVRNWNVGLENRIYYGQDLMPFYNDVDNGGYKYGNDLYAGCPFYRVHTDGGKKWAVYDRLEVYYQPHIADFLDLRLAVTAHFPDGFRYEGLQQKLSLIFSLDKLLNPSGKSSGEGRVSGRKRSRRSSAGTWSGEIFGI